MILARSATKSSFDCCAGTTSQLGRTIDLPAIDAQNIGALLMHFMIETILTGYALDIDPFDQPAVELAKALTRQNLAGTDRKSVV